MSLTESLFDKAQKLAPTFSATELAAMNIGDPWWEKEMLSGQPNWLKLHSLRLATLTAEEQQFLDNETEILCNMLDDWRINFNEQDLPESVWDYIRAAGFWGLVLPKSYGGKGFGPSLHSQVIMKIASKSLTAAVTVMVPNSLGPGELLLHYGTEAQKNHYLPRLSQGEEIPCFALTGPQAGSDATSMPDYGVVCKGKWEGKEVLGVRLSFSKRYITLAPVATLIALAVKFIDPEHLLGQEQNLGITLCLIERHYPGLIIGNRHIPLDQAFMNGTIEALEMFVPLDTVIGGKEYIGRGWQMLVECLATGRSISLPAISAAYGALCYLTTGAYTALREQFKTPIKEFEGIQASMAQIAGMSYILDACRLMTLTANDQGKKPSVASAIAKYHMTELARKILNHAMDIHGGRGIMMGPHNYLGRAYQGIPICITVEGANILTRNLMIFGQGVMLDHPYLRALAESLQESGDLAEQHFKKALKGFVGRFCKQLGKRLWLGVSFGLFVSTPESKMHGFYRKASILSNRLALLADLSLVFLGAKLKRSERLSARLGDVMSYLYLATSVLKYYQHFYEPDEELTVAKWASQYCLGQARTALAEFVDNFTSIIPRFLLRWLIVPSKRRFANPKDHDDKKLAQFLTEPSALRTRFQSYCAINPMTNLGMMSVENAYQCLQKAKPLLSKIKTILNDAKLKTDLPLVKQVEMAFQQGLLTKDEWKIFLDYMIHHEDALQVDTFTYNLQLCKRNPVNLNVSLETQFEEMVERLATGKLNFQLTSAQKLELYGLHQQVTFGDIACATPSATDFVARAKYQAWEKCKGMSKQEAMQVYINLLAG